VPRYAAIDIGSNSIRMEAAEVSAGQPPRVLASDREVTRLGESVFRNGAVSEEAIQATWAVLARMAALHRKLAVVGVRAVATSAVRDMRNQREFLGRASEAVGAHVEIISGREEARLIHLGVESVWPSSWCFRSRSMQPPVRYLASIYELLSYPALWSTMLCRKRLPNRSGVSICNRETGSPIGWGCDGLLCPAGLSFANAAGQNVHNFQS
jgi:hypothetical protein